LAVQQEIKLLGEYVIAYGAKGLSRVREKRNLDSDKIN
jgi:hypothetical protein